MWNIDTLPPWVLDTLRLRQTHANRRTEIKSIKTHWEYRCVLCFSQRVLWSCASLKWFKCVLESTSVYFAALSRPNVNPVAAFGCVEVVWIRVTSPYLAHPEQAVTYEHLQTPEAYLARSHPANHNIRRKQNGGLLSALESYRSVVGEKTLAGRAQMDFRIINNSALVLLTEALQEAGEVQWVALDGSHHDMN